MTIKLPELHYHSITAHVPCVTVPLTALAYGLHLAKGGNFLHTAHVALTVVSLLSFLAVFPTGWLDREKMYTNWTPLFRAKLVLSIVHGLALLYQVIALVQASLSATAPGMAYAVVTVGVQTLLIIALTWLGTITAQGRVGGRISYRSDPEYKLSYDMIKTVKESQPDPLKEAPYDRL